MATQTPWEVLNEADDETAQLMVKLQLEDIEAANSDGDAGTDSGFALQSYQTELVQYRAVRHFEGEETELAKASVAAAATSAEEEEDAPEPPTENQEQQIMLFECASCLEKYDADQCYPVPCQHHYCDTCLQNLFINSMDDETLYPPRCCKMIIPLDEVRAFMPEKVGDEFERKRKELDNRRRVYCRAPECGASARHSSATSAARHGRTAAALSGKRTGYWTERKRSFIVSTVMVQEWPMRAMSLLQSGT
ncbi:hypothetical protein LTR85_002543 [Meristemomyces frigidus]|nr:hypothetical protein LTR85_002543 [Meristemomyces frigidus]